MMSYDIGMSGAGITTAHNPPDAGFLMRSYPDLRALEILTEASRLGGVGAAARALGFTQPHASRLLAALERDLGLELLTRSPSGSVPTVAGRLVVDWAAPLLRSADRLVAGVSSLHQADAGDVLVGASLTIGEHLVPAWLGTFAARHPERRVHLRVTNSAAVLTDLRSAAIDLGFIEGPHRAHDLHTTTVATDELVVVVPPRHPWARRRDPLPAAELAATPLILREQGSGSRETLEATLTAHPRTPPLMELSSSEAIRRAVAAGAGPAVLSVLAVEGALRAGDVHRVPLADGPLRRQLRAVWRPPRRPAPWAADFIAIAKGR